MDIKSIRTCCKFTWSLNLVDFGHKRIKLVIILLDFVRPTSNSAMIEWLERCVMTTGIISSVNLRNAVILALFSQLLATKLENIISLVEKARKLPRDVIFKRMVGLEGGVSKF